MHLTFFNRIQQKLRIKYASRIILLICKNMSKMLNVHKLSARIKEQCLTFDAVIYSPSRNSFVQFGIQSLTINIFKALLKHSDNPKLQNSTDIPSLNLC